MELCTVQSISKLPDPRGFLASNPSESHLLPKSSIRFRQTPLIRRSALLSRSIFLRNLSPKATTSEETSSGGSQYIDEKRDGAIIVEDVKSNFKNVFNSTVATDEAKEESPANEQWQASEFMDNLNLKIIDGIHRVLDETSAVMSNLSGYLSNLTLDPDDASSILLYGSGAVVAVWLASAIVGAIDSIPVFPKLLEIVGLGYTLWFGSRYLLFKRNRDELFAKIEELKEEIVGSEDD